MDYNTKMLSDNNICELEEAIKGFIENEYGYINVNFDLHFIGILKNSMYKNRIVTAEVFYVINDDVEKMNLHIIYEADYSILYISKLDIERRNVMKPYDSAFISNNSEKYIIFTYL